MPREIALVTARPVTLQSLAEAGLGVDPDLVVRALFDGRVLQLVDAPDGAPADQGDPVLSLEVSRRLDDTSGVAGLVGPVALPAGEVWWTQAWASWAAAADRGVTVAERLSVLLEGTAVVQDGR